MSTYPPARSVAEVEAPGDLPLWLHPEWAERFPWLVQGTTGAGDPADPFDLGLSGDGPVGGVLGRWRRLRAALEAETVAHARQVHGADVWDHRERGAPGIAVMEGVDGHATDLPGLLLTVSVADCVPVSVVDARQRVVALLHSGWKGTAAGITERGVRLLAEGYGSDPADLWLHCGPAICGACYEVGPEVHTAVNPAVSPPEAPTCINLRAEIAARAVGMAVPPEQVTVSAHCTRCGPGAFFSHRGGSPARQMGVLGVR